MDSMYTKQHCSHDPSIEQLDVACTHSGYIQHSDVTIVQGLNVCGLLVWTNIITCSLRGILLPLFPCGLHRRWTLGALEVQSSNSNTKVSRGQVH